MGALLPEDFPCNPICLQGGWIEPKRNSFVCFVFTLFSVISLSWCLEQQCLGILKVNPAFCINIRSQPSLCGYSFKGRWNWGPAHMHGLLCLTRAEPPKPWSWGCILPLTCAWQSHPWSSSWHRVQYCSSPGDGKAMAPACARCPPSLHLPTPVPKQELQWWTRLKLNKQQGQNYLGTHLGVSFLNGK